MSPLQAERLLRVAKAWAAFQDPDSLEDQKTDGALHSEAIEARETLLSVIEDISVRS